MLPAVTVSLNIPFKILGKIQGIQKSICFRGKTCYGTNRQNHQFVLFPMNSNSLFLKMIPNFWLQIKNENGSLINDYPN